MTDNRECIEERKAEFKNYQNIADAAQQLANALQQSDDTEAVSEDFDAQTETKNEVESLGLIDFEANGNSKHPSV